MAEMDEAKIQEIVAQVVQNLRAQGVTAGSSPLTSASQAGQLGVFDTVDAAVEASSNAQKQLERMGIAKRREIIEALREAAMKHAQELAELAVRETGMGRVEHKVVKNEGAARMSGGVEDITSESVTGDDGALVVEYAPFGVINSITPTTNPTSTVINHAIIMIAGGNSVVFSPHPNAKECSLRTMHVLNEAIASVGGPDNLLVGLSEPTLRNAKRLMDHPRVAMVVATGGPSVVRAALSSGKKAIAAGPGNPPAVVDETADVPKAARDIVEGASFDNDVLCIGEKEVFVIDSVADELLREMVKQGAYLVDSRQTAALEQLLIQDGHPNKDFIGKDATYILSHANIQAPADTRLVILETPPDHTFVVEEFLLPVVPIVRTRSFEDALQYAVRAEQGNGHTAIIHSQRLDRITRFAQAMQTTVLVANGPSYAAGGIEGEGFLTMTISGATGEGFTSPKTFTRQRRTTVVGGLSFQSLPPVL